MRITDSSISLIGSSTSYEKSTKEETLKTWVGNRPVFEGETRTGLPQNSSAGLPAMLLNNMDGDFLQLSDEGKKALEEQAAAAQSIGSPEENLFDLTDKEKQKLFLIQSMIEALTGKKIKFVLPDKIKLDKDKIKLDFAKLKLNQEHFRIDLAKLKLSHEKIRLEQNQVQSNPAEGEPLRILDRQPVLRTTARQGWGLEYDLHESHYEKQTMNFSAEGKVKTADGKVIQFDLDLNMSREFASRTDVSIRAGDAVKIDPLVVNFGSPSASLTNNKFSFDIDTDGNNDEISFATGGSGFLAFDINQDGTINNGAELFGPKSGNGFSDLAAYDGDNNGWIDENDEIYNKLRIWTKDESGNDQLFALGAKGIGAIYLGNTATAFDLKTAANDTKGSIASTGIFLRENGTAGTIQHVDLVI